MHFRGVGVVFPIAGIANGRARIDAGVVDGDIELIAAKVEAGRRAQASAAVAATGAALTESDALKVPAMAIIVAHATLRDLVMVPPIFGSSDLIAVPPEPVGDDVDEILNGPHVGEVARLQVQPVVLECPIGDGEKCSTSCCVAPDVIADRLFQDDRIDAVRIEQLPKNRDDQGHADGARLSARSTRWRLPAARSRLLSARWRSPGSLCHWFPPPILNQGV